MCKIYNELHIEGLRRQQLDQSAKCQKYYPAVQPVAGGVRQRQDIAQQQFKQICKLFCSIRFDNLDNLDLLNQGQICGNTIYSFGRAGRRQNNQLSLGKSMYICQNLNELAGSYPKLLKNQVKSYRPNEKRKKLSHILPVVFVQRRGAAQ